MISNQGNLRKLHSKDSRELLHECICNAISIFIFGDNITSDTKEVNDDFNSVTSSSNSEIRQINSSEESMDSEALSDLERLRRLGISVESTISELTKFHREFNGVSELRAVHLMNPSELFDERMLLRSRLLKLERDYGRPRSPRSKRIASSLYSRYRIIKEECRNMNIY
ncbi:hypothetical protein GJ496_009003 [Pomphorhynchus laevis]|nr:hypothetical protein GJ496_009003 [Pomphorhynchus laevis]